MFGKWLKEERIKKSLTRKQLGDIAGISASTVGQIERETIKRPPLNRLKALAELFKVSLDKLKKMIMQKGLAVAGILLTPFFINAGQLHVVSFSGGKDSTCMMDLMVLNNMKIDYAVFADLGKEFPEMYQHMKMVESLSGIKVIHLKPEFSFDYYSSEKPVRSRETGEIHKYGYGWCGGQCRWGTSMKKQLINKFIREVKGHKNVIEYIGIAFDEPQRIKREDRRNLEYPLFEWRIKEDQALEYCYEQGYSWGGLYNNLDRVSCYCCRNKNLKELKYIYKNRPELWKQLKESEKKFGQMKSSHSLEELESRYNRQDLQLTLF